MLINKYSFYQKFLLKVSDDHFYNALKIVTCAIIIFGIIYNTIGATVAFGLIMGVILCSPMDTSSSIKNKCLGIGITAVLLPTITVVLTLSYTEPILFYSLFTTFIFLSSYISLYGQRATSLSFSILLGICLSFMHITDSKDALNNGLYMFFGSLLYLVISILFYLIRPTKYILLEISICMNTIAQYLDLRSQYWQNNPDINSIKEKQILLQINITDSLNKINEYLEANKNKVETSDMNKKIVLSMSFLNEILENAISTPFSYEEIQEEIDQHKDLKNSIKALTTSFVNILEQLSDSLRFNTYYNRSEDLSNNLKLTQDEVNKTQNTTGVNSLFITSIMNYLDNQVKNIQSLEFIYEKKKMDLSIEIPKQEAEIYIQANHYRLKSLQENLNFKSIYFRYALRVTLALLAGLIFGNFISLEKEYWVLLTIVVIIRPGYGLTKDRMYKRVLGTIIGGMIGLVILYFITNTTVLAILTFIAMLCSYIYSSTNYKTGVTFTTILLILLYGILKTGADQNLIYRIIDTLTGAFIAFLSMRFLWPSWEFSSIRNNLMSSISNTISYVETFGNVYFNNDSSSFTELETSRKNSFIAIGNLLASYQRLIQEPKDKQKNRSVLYEITLLNQTLLDEMASLGSFIRLMNCNNSNNNYTKHINTIIHNLQLSLTNLTPSLSNKDQTNTWTNNEVSENVNSLQLASTNDKDTESLIIQKQLYWIINLSEQIKNSSNKIEQ